MSNSLSESQKKELQRRKELHKEKKEIARSEKNAKDEAKQIDKNKKAEDKQTLRQNSTFLTPQQIWEMILAFLISAKMIIEDIFAFFDDYLNLPKKIADFIVEQFSESISNTEKKVSKEILEPSFRIVVMFPFYLLMAMNAIVINKSLLNNGKREASKENVKVRNFMHNSPLVKQMEQFVPYILGPTKIFDDFSFDDKDTYYMKHKTTNVIVFFITLLTSIFIFPSLMPSLQSYILTAVLEFFIFAKYVYNMFAKTPITEDDTGGIDTSNTDPISVSKSLPDGSIALYPNQSLASGMISSATIAGGVYNAFIVLGHFIMAVLFTIPATFIMVLYTWIFKLFGPWFLFLGKRNFLTVIQDVNNEEIKNRPNPSQKPIQYLFYWLYKYKAIIAGGLISIIGSISLFQLSDDILKIVSISIMVLFSITFGSLFQYIMNKLSGSEL